MYFFAFLMNSKVINCVNYAFHGFFISFFICWREQTYSFSWLILKKNVTVTGVSSFYGSNFWYSLNSKSMLQKDDLENDKLRLVVYMFWEDSALNFDWWPSCDFSLECSFSMQIFDSFLWRACGSDARLLPKHS